MRILRAVQAKMFELEYLAHKTHDCPMGRPKEKNLVTLNLTLDASEKRMLRRMAKANHESVSRLVGRLAREQEGRKSGSNTTTPKRKQADAPRTQYPPATTNNAHLNDR